MLYAFCAPPFYTKFVTAPTGVPFFMQRNPKFWPYFQHAIGAIDGTQIICAPSLAMRSACRDHKGFVSQNCLFCCSFKLQFTYSYTGWEGSATDARVFHAARLSGTLEIPDGKYYLADAGFGMCPQLLTPYPGVRYHLAEWGHANLRYGPCN